MKFGTIKTICIGALLGSLIVTTMSGCGKSDDKGKEAANTGTKDLAKLCASEKGPLVVGTYGGKYDDALKEAVVKKFKDKYKVDVIFEPGYNTSKLIAESGHPSVDVGMQDDITLYQGVEDSMQKIDASLLTHAGELYDGAVDKSGYGIYLLWGRYGIVYRTDKVKEKPTSWNDLWDDKYKGRVTMNQFGASNTIQMLEMSGKLNGGNNKDLTKSWEKFGVLASHCKAVAASTANLTDMLTTGQVVIAPWWDGRAYALKAEGVPVDFVVPKEGAYATITELIIPKGAKNPYLAHAFIDMCIESEAQGVLAKIIKYGPVNKNTKLDADTAKIVLNGPDDVKKLIFCDWKTLAPLRTKLTSYYDRNIAPLIGTDIQ
ncbi:MAG: hypothetical protein ACFWT7_00225 [Succiniclasticum sp.]|jgi:putative spermidine/putrescine transport system substrate-binding protein